MSLKTILRRYLILCSCIPLILASILAYNLNTSRLLHLQGDTLWQLARTNSYGLLSSVETQVTELSLLAMQSNINNLLLNHPSLDKNKSQYINHASSYTNDLLSARANSYPACIDITLYNQNKEVISSSNPKKLWTTYNNSSTISFLSITKKSVIGISGLKKIEEHHLSNNNNKDIDNNSHYIEIGAPVFRKNTSTLIGYIISSVNVNHMEHYIKALNLDKSGRSYVIDKYGQIIYHPEEELISSVSSSTKLKSILKDYQKGNIPINGTFTWEENGKESLFGYAIMPELEWILLVQQDVDEIVHLANVNLSIILFTMFIGIIILLIISNYVANKYTNPILNLKSAMHDASNGNPPIYRDTSSIKEFNELFFSFNKMNEIISNNYEELNLIHKELVVREDVLRDQYNKIEYLAYHDTITGLPNKNKLIQLKENELLSARSEDSMILVSSKNKIESTSYSIYYIDIDNFKSINDTLGYDMGDATLIEVAKRLQSYYQSKDVITKVGGDEFLIYHPNLQSKNESEEIANQLLQLFNEPLLVQGKTINLTISIGIAITYNNSLYTISDTIKHAEIAMYQAKYNGKNTLLFFEFSMEECILRKNMILSVLRDCIDNDELFIHYQPQIDISNNQLFGFEALMRINSSKLGFISPVEFIPIAEETGLILPLGSKVLYDACYYTKQLQESGYGGLIVSINISPIQLNHPSFIDTLSNVLEETKLEAQYIELEVTESALISSLNKASTLLHNIIALGVRIALDDFGTGYSSLNYLTKMPIHTLKIDKSFIDNITKSTKDSYIADTIIQLAHNLNMTVIAEGVEDMEQLELLKKKNCDIIQGYIFSKALSTDDLYEFIQFKLN